MDFQMPPAPGEFVALPSHAQAPVPASQAMVPASAGSLAPREPSFQQLQAQAFQQIQQQQAALAQEHEQIRQMMAQRGAPMGADNAAAADGSTALGITLVAVAAGAVLGGVFGGGATGAAGGALLGAAAANGFKAAKSVTKGDAASDKEAMVDGTFALGGAALGI